MKKALLFGATGFIGSHLLKDLLKSSIYDGVTVVVRKPLSGELKNHPKLKMLIGDYRSLPKLKTELVADDVFIALGTTKKQTPDEAEYYRVDHDYPVFAAKLAKENGAKSVSIVTAIGASSDSPFFYIKTKGETERDIKALGFTATHIFQPSMIVGHRKEERAMEKVFIGAWNVVDPFFVGRMDRLKGIDGKDVAKAMLLAAQNQTDRLKIFRWREMHDLLKRDV